MRETGAISRAESSHINDWEHDLVNIRVGVHEFVSARPLIYGLTRRQAREVELVFQEPGELAESFRRLRLNAALVPSIEFLRGAGKCYLEGPALVARPSAGSLLLISRRPAEMLRRVAVGEFCRTPVAVARIVLAEKFGAKPDLCVCKDIRGDWRERYDGVLLNGDDGLRYLASRPDPDDTVINLAALWDDLTSLPLVMSMWAYDDPALSAQIAKIMVLSRNLGLQNLSTLADGIAQSTPYNGEMIYDYLTNCWEYQLTPEALEGLRALEEYALSYDLIRHGRLSQVTAR
jgi:chorismate dehydratase